MKAIIEHIVLVTRLLGAPVSEAALSAEVVRDKKLKVNYHSLSKSCAATALKTPYPNAIWKTSPRLPCRS